MYIITVVDAVVMAHHRVRRLMTGMGLAPIYQRAKDQRAAEPGPDTVGNRAETAWGREANSRPRQIAGT